MRYTDAEIEGVILKWIDETRQDELRYLIPFLLGYFGYISKQIWRVVEYLISRDLLK